MDNPPFLRRLGRACHDHRWRVVLAWVASLVLLAVLVGAVGSGFKTEFTLPDVESARGADILDEHFGGVGAGAGGTIVFETGPEIAGGVTNPEVEQAMTELFTHAQAESGIPVVSPYDQSQPGVRQVSESGTVAFAIVEFPRDVSVAEARDLRDVIEEAAPDIEGLRIELGGQLFAGFEAPDSEVLGLAFAVVILILAFGSVIAMGLPIGTALFGIVSGVLLATILSNVLEIPEFALTIGVMIGLGVGIDYALFIVTRYREELHAGRDEAEAVAVAINTAGRAVLFAGLTVVISLLGMVIMNLAFVTGFALSAASVVLVTMIASVTLLPALLGFVGQNIEVTKWRGIVAAGLVSLALLGIGLGITPAGLALPLAVVVLIVGSFGTPLARVVPHRAPKPKERTLPYRWSRLVQRRPWPAAILGTVFLVVLALPLLDLRLGFSDEGNYPEDTTTREAYELLAEGFGPGSNGPLVLVAEVPPGTDLAAIERVTQALVATEGVAEAVGFPNGLPPTAAIWRVVPETAPQDESTEALVNHIRGDILPAAVAGTDLEIAVTGGTAVSVDFSQYLGERLPIFMLVVLTLSFLLLMAVFRSLLVPLKAVIMNLLSIGAAYGLAVAVFQWGWLADVFGVQATGPIEPFIPMMLFAIVFGLSMDYEVFLLSRMKEEYDRGAPNDVAVADGLATTARVITAAAAIMVFVFGSFLLEADRVVKLLGFGLGMAVLLDATVVRLLLVPATMELLGDRNWWLPKWLDRLLPRIDVEGEHHVPPPAVEPVSDDEREPEPVG